MDKLVNRFLKYISIDSKSSEDSSTIPSTKGQIALGELLVEELKEIGMSNVFQDENEYLYGELNSNIDYEVATIGFIAHLDTAPDLDGKCINPQIIKYNGGDIVLNEKYSIKESEFPILKDLKGLNLITTDGTTLLGADDKAGIAAIINAMEYLINNPEIPHGTIKIAFTPDEEIGHGCEFFNIEVFSADFAYTIDGGPIGELEFENFNAASCKIHIEGKNVHPGTAKNIMLNASLVGMELNSMLPAEERPEYTDGYEGFFLLTDFKGSVDHCNMNYIIRDHSRVKFEEKKTLIKDAVAFLNKKYNNIINIELNDSYYNMREKVEAHMEIIDLAKNSMIKLGIEPNIKPIRGGTDGASLSFMGLPCPNIFTGGYNFHGRFEFIPIEHMELASKTIVMIAENNTKR